VIICKERGRNNTRIMGKKSLWEGGGEVPSVNVENHQIAVCRSGGKSGRAFKGKAGR